MLGAGTSFGESILTNKPRHATVVTQDFTELIRVEQKDFKILWEVGDHVSIISVQNHSLSDLGVCWGYSQTSVNQPPKCGF